MQKRKDFPGQICNLWLETSENGTYCPQFSGVGSTLHTLRNFQVSEGEKTNGLENDVFKTCIRRSFQDVH